MVSDDIRLIPIMLLSINLCQSRFRKYHLIYKNYFKFSPGGFYFYLLDSTAIKQQRPKVPHEYGDL